MYICKWSMLDVATCYKLTLELEPLPLPELDPLELYYCKRWDAEGVDVQVMWMWSEQSCTYVSDQFYASRHAYSPSSFLFRLTSSPLILLFLSRHQSTHARSFQCQRPPRAGLRQQRSCEKDENREVRKVSKSFRRGRVNKRRSTTVIFI